MSFLKIINKTLYHDFPHYGSMFKRIVKPNTFPVNIDKFNASFKNISTYRSFSNSCVSIFYLKEIFYAAFILLDNVLFIHFFLPFLNIEDLYLLHM